MATVTDAEMKQIYNALKAKNFAGAAGNLQLAGLRFVPHYFR